MVRSLVVQFFVATCASCLYLSFAILLEDVDKSTTCLCSWDDFLGLEMNG